jgi:hypothetical protein
VVMMVTLICWRERAFDRSSNGRVWPWAMKGKMTTWDAEGEGMVSVPLLSLAFLGAWFALSTNLCVFLDGAKYCCLYIDSRRQCLTSREFESLNCNGKII